MTWNILGTYDNISCSFCLWFLGFFFFFISWVNLVQLEQEVQQMSNVRLKWSMLTTDRLCWLPEPPCEKGGNCICQDREGRAGTATCFPFGLLFFASLCCLSSDEACEEKTVEENSFHTRKMDRTKRICCVKFVCSCPCLGCAVPLILWET